MFGKTRKKIRIGIDARFYGPLGKGLGRYTQEVVDNVIALDKDNEYVIFLSRDNFDELVTDNPRVKKVMANVRWYGFAEQIFMPFHIWRRRVDLMHFPHFNVPVLCPTKFVVTIHDLILTKFPTMRATTLGPLMYFFKNLFYRIVIGTAVWRAEKVIAVSEFTKKDILENFKIPPEKVIMIYEGVANLSGSSDRHFSSKLKSDQILTGYCILEPYLLYVGNAYPHKNLETLVRVFKKINATMPELKLVIVGKEDYFNNRVREFAKRHRAESVIFPGYVPDRELEVLFSRATAYVFPSKYEGFGLPPLEAMARNCPVASSNATCLPEILGDAAIYFDPTDERDMETVIRRLIEDKKLRSTLGEKGLKQAAGYSWERCGRETLAVYITS